jgi:endonuclease I
MAIEVTSPMAWSPANRAYMGWSKADPVDQWEQLRDRRIAAVQGNKNPFVR